MDLLQSCRLFATCQIPKIAIPVASSRLLLICQIISLCQSVIAKRAAPRDADRLHAMLLATRGDFEFFMIALRALRSTLVLHAYDNIRCLRMILLRLRRAVLRISLRGRVIRASFVVGTIHPI